jgi:hypothetical protein
MLRLMVVYVTIGLGNNFWELVAVRLHPSSRLLRDPASLLLRQASPLANGRKRRWVAAFGFVFFNVLNTYAASMRPIFHDVGNQRTGVRGL